MTGCQEDTGVKRSEAANDSGMSWQLGVQASINFGVCFEDTWCLSELWEDDLTPTHI